MLRNNQRAWNVRALLESTDTPFAASNYRPREVIFTQGGRCDSVMHIESGTVQMAVTAPNGKEAIVGLLGRRTFFSQETIAEMIGTTRSRVNVFMSKFKKLGFIEETGGLLHVLPALLHVVQDADRAASARAGA